MVVLGNDRSAGATNDRLHHPEYLCHIQANWGSQAEQRPYMSSVFPAKTTPTARMPVAICARASRARGNPIGSDSQSR